MRARELDGDLVVAPLEHAARGGDVGARSPPCEMSPTQGAVQRWIWYCRHGRVRLAK